MNPAASVGEEAVDPAAAVSSATGQAGVISEGLPVKGIPLENPDDFDVAEQKKLTVFQRVSKLNVGQRNQARLYWREGRAGIVDP